MTYLRKSELWFFLNGLVENLVYRKNQIKTSQKIRCSRDRFCRAPCFSEIFFVFFQKPWCFFERILEKEFFNLFLGRIFTKHFLKNELMNQHFFGYDSFSWQKRISQKKVSKHHGFWKKRKKFFIPKNRTPGKTGIFREPRYFRDFFILPHSFLKLNSLQAHLTLTFTPIKQAYS